jgi:hypothetical protein
MNRNTAIVLGLAILLAHTLALHKDPSGAIAAPYDVAHVAYRIARNGVHSGSLAWESGVFFADSYPSLLWIAVAAAGERLYLSVSSFCQGVGLVSALATAVALSRFSPVRLSGVIAPLFFVVSGGIASAALSGTETATVAWLVTSAFLAYERGYGPLFAAFATLACLSRPHACVFVAALLAIEAVRALLKREPGRKPLIAWFAAPALALGVLSLARHAATGRWISPWTELLFARDPRVVREGLAYLLDFVRASGAAALIAFPLWYLVRGALGGVGLRALALVLAWSGAVAATGGGSLPFFEAMTPILAVLLVAVQEAMQIALDSKRRRWPQVTWALFLLGIASSVLVSKYPGNLGPFPVERVHREWMQPGTTARFGYQEPLGRLGLGEEVLYTARLREIGIFLRDHVDPDCTVLTPWPGAIGYLSRLQVIDALGRTAPVVAGERPRPWEGVPRADVLAALQRDPSYIVPTLTFGDEAPTAQSIAADWVKALDLHPERAGRARAIREELSSYELITVPAGDSPGARAAFGRGRFYLLRRGELGLAPSLEVEVEGREVVVSARHRADEQIADLRVQVVERSGRVWSMRPNGEATRHEDALARVSLLLFPSGERRIELYRARLPDDLDLVEVRAVLRNPGAVDDSLFSATSEEVTAAVE